LQGYAAVWDLFNQGFWESCADLISLVSVRFSLDRQHGPFGNPAQDIQIMEMFTDQVERKYHRPDLLRQLQQYQFQEIQLPDMTIEVNVVESEIRQNFSIPQPWPLPVSSAESVLAVTSESSIDNSDKANAANA
jgi:hypothetical protein